MSPLLCAYLALTTYVTYKLATSWNTIKGFFLMLLTKVLVNYRHVDGHMMAGAPIRWKSYFDDVNFFGREYSNKYGRVYYVWHWLQPVVVLADVDAIRSFYKDHFSHKRDMDFSCGSPALKDILGTALGPTYGRENVRAYRAHFEPYFSSNFVHAQHSLIGQAIDQWMASLPLKQSLDLGKCDLTEVALKTLMCTTYGSDVMTRHLAEVKRILHLHNEALASDGRGLHRIGMTMFRTIFPNWLSASMKLFKSEWNSFHEKILQEREKKVLKNTEGIFFLLHDHIISGLVDLSYQQLLDTVDEILLFNVDISFAATSFVIHDLAKYPEVQDRARQEVDNALGDNDPVNVDNLETKLPYLHMVIKESARMHPALGVTFPERTVKEQTNMAGYIIPKDTVVSIDPYSVNYNPDHWPEPETFNPLRFAAGKSHVPYSFFRFGLGPRKCLGYRLAQSLIVLVIVKLLQRHEVTHSTPGAEPLVKTEGIPFFSPYLTPNIVLTPRTKQSQ